MHFRFQFLRVLFAFLLLSACSEPGATQHEALASDSQFTPGETVDFTFRSNDHTLSGIFDTLDQTDAQGLILFIHGYGPTDVRGHNMYAELRQRFNALGFATATWDKPGLGLSSGTFDINQSVYESADEVIAATDYLRTVNAPGSTNIGLWGISRAGWIAPIALSRDEAINFWISVSGVTAEDNFPHLLLSNLPHEGTSPEDVEIIRSEWQKGCEAQRTGQSYETFLSLTPTLRSNAYITDMRGDWPTKAQYEAQQSACVNGDCPNVDDELCAYIFINDFDHMLSELKVDMLALFGEKDLNIDWKKVRTLYQDTIGQNPSSSLQIATFPEGDHNLNKAETGSLTEMMTRSSYEKVEDYYAVQTEWLTSTILSTPDR